MMDEELERARLDAEAEARRRKRLSKELKEEEATRIKYDDVFLLFDGLISGFFFWSSVDFVKGWKPRSKRSERYWTWRQRRIEREDKVGMRRRVFFFRYWLMIKYLLAEREKQEELRRKKEAEEDAVWAKVLKHLSLFYCWTKKKNQLQEERRRTREDEKRHLVHQHSVNIDRTKLREALIAGPSAVHTESRDAMQEAPSAALSRSYAVSPSHVIAAVRGWRLMVESLVFSHVGGCSEHQGAVKPRSTSSSSRRHWQRRSDKQVRGRRGGRGGISLRFLVQRSAWRRFKAWRLQTQSSRLNWRLQRV